MKHNLKSFILTAALGIAAFLPAVARAEVVTVEATGVGQTRAEAVTHGLVEAVQKATGVRIDQLAITGLNQRVLQVDANANQSSGARQCQFIAIGVPNLNRGGAVAAFFLTVGKHPFWNNQFKKDICKPLLW